jgi:hypothetical protein
MSRYSKIAGAAIAGIIEEAGPSASLIELKGLIRRAGPQRPDRPEFRVWHQEGKRAIDAVRADRLSPVSGIDLFS